MNTLQPNRQASRMTKLQALSHPVLSIRWERVPPRLRGPVRVTVSYIPRIPLYVCCCVGERVAINLYGRLSRKKRAAPLGEIATLNRSPSTLGVSPEGCQLVGETVGLASSW